MAEPITIYVYLPDEQVDVWRPVQAQPLGKGLYRILSINPDPEGEKWQFGTGEVVRVRKVNLVEGSKSHPCLVAVAKIEAKDGPKDG